MGAILEDWMGMVDGWVPPISEPVGIFAVEDTNGFVATAIEAGEWDSTTALEAYRLRLRDDLRACMQEEGGFGCDRAHELREALKAVAHRIEHLRIVRGIA